MVAMVPSFAFLLWIYNDPNDHYADNIAGGPHCKYCLISQRVRELYLSDGKVPVVSFRLFKDPCPDLSCVKISALGRLGNLCLIRLYKPAARGTAGSSGHFLQDGNTKYGHRIVFRKPSSKMIVTRFEHEGKVGALSPSQVWFARGSSPAQ